MPDRTNPVVGAFRALVPPPLRPRIRSTYHHARWRLRTSAPWRLVRRWIARGDRVSCPCCGGSFGRFLPYRNRPQAECPDCFSLERHRLLWIFLRDRTDVLTAPTTVLHFAPEWFLSRTLSSRPNVRYASVDKYAGGVMARADMTALPFRDETFDAIIEVHVIQNIENDGAALSELRRVMRLGGWAILQENTDRTRESTLEDPVARATELGRERAFGFHEFVRRYGRDFPSRVEAFGFESRYIEFGRELGAETRRRYGLHDEPVYLFRARPIDSRSESNGSRQVEQSDDSRSGRSGAATSGVA